MADNVEITAGSGTTIATDDVGSGVQVQRVKPVWGGDGVANDITIADPLPVQLEAEGDVYAIDIPSQVHVAAASTVHWDLFNADAAIIVMVLSVRQIPDIVTAVTGVATAWLFQRTSAVGTGGTGLTPWPIDTTDSLDADITARSKPSGGATTGTQLRSYSIHSEETNTGTQAIAAQGGMELLPMALCNAGGIRLGQNQGLKCTQNTNSNAGNTGWQILFAVV